MLIECKGSFGVLRFNEESTSESIGLALRALRLERGLSIREVASLAGDKSANSYFECEKGRSAVSLERIEKYVKALYPGAKIVLKLNV